MDILNFLSPCSIKTETATHYFQLCRFYNANMSALINDLSGMDSSFSALVKNKFIDLILYALKNLMTK